VIHHQHDDLLGGGTDIEGQFENLIDLQEQKLACLTVAGRAIRNQPGILARLSTALAEADINIETSASGMDSVTFYTSSEDGERAEALIHEEVIENDTLSSVTLEREFAAIRITGGELQRQGGAVSRILAPLAEEHVYLHDVMTSATSVSLLVDWDDRDRALEILQEGL